MLTFSCGKGKRNPAALRRTTADLAASLDGAKPLDEGWWSPHVWRGDQRAGEAWESSCAVAVDVDHYVGDKHAHHVDGGQAVVDAWKAETLPGSCFHLTPRGFRLVFTLRAQETDRQRYAAAARGACEATQQALRLTGLEGMGYKVDFGASTDLARLLWTPACLVSGEVRSAKVLDNVGREPFDAWHLAALALPEVRDDGGGGGGADKPGAEAFLAAVQAYNAAHPLAWPNGKNSLPCPACGGKASFGALPKDETRWFCWHDKHGERAGKVGVRTGRGYLGDSLDLAAHAAGKARLRVLLDEGLLTPTDVPAERVLIPGAHETPDGYVEVGTDDFAGAVLAKVPTDTLYRRDRIVGVLAGATGRRRFVALTPNAMRLVVDGAVTLGRWVTRKDQDPVQVFVPCSSDLAALVLEAAATSTRVREINAVTHYPVVLGAGMDIARAGWNEVAGLYYDEPADLVGLDPLAECPTVADAWQVLDETWTDFPFGTEADRENFYGALLTPVVRPGVEGNVPMHLVLAAKERTGKTMLLNSIGWVLGDDDVPALQAGTTEEEREKRITSLLLSGETAVHLDNLPTTSELDSPSLASLLTSRTWKGRTLGRSEMPTLRNTLVLYGSGNNVRTSAEIAKRIVPVLLQTRTPNPEERADFQHPDLRGYVRANRRRILAALLRLVYEWRAKGQPAPHAVPDDRPSTRVRLGGFEEWVRVVGGVLVANGSGRWCSNLREWLRRADDVAQDRERLVQAWWDKFQGSEVSAAAVLDLVKALEVFPRVTSRSPEVAQQANALARQVLKPMADLPVARWYVRVRAYGSNSRYFLEPNPDTPQPVPPPPPAAPRPAPKAADEGLGGWPVA